MTGGQLILMVLLAACTRAPVEEPAPEPPAEEPPAQAPDEQPPAQVPDDDAAEATFTYIGWPGEGIPEITATKYVDVQYAMEPGGPGVVSCALGEGEKLEYSRSVVRTESAAPVSLEAPHVLPEGSISHGAVQTLDPSKSEGTSVAGRTIGTDADVEHLAFRAEGTCLYRIDGDVVETQCFHDMASSASTSWWVLAPAGCGAAVHGWLRVDNLDALQVERRF